MTTQTTRRWKYGFKRWIVLGLLITAGVLAFGLSGTFPPFKPVIPAVVLPGEELWPGAEIVPPFSVGSFHFGGIPFTNTILSTLLTDLLLIMVAVFVVRPFLRGHSPVPGKIYAGLEMLVDYFYNLVKTTVGAKWVWRVLPIVLTVFLLILSANLVKLIPGYETIGRLEAVGPEAGTNAHPILPLAGNLFALNGTAPKDACLTAACYELFPFLRGSATDINFPAAMAVFVVACIFVFGIGSQRGAFFGKYFPVQRTIDVPMFGLIDFFVGLLEFFLEFMKVISLTLRLFFNIFAGGLLIMIIGSLTVVFIPAGFIAFELFVGAIQAYVFAMLALIFIQLSMLGHSGGNEAAH
ncbi:MAG: F0F1 ATP synthase subunit A [Anaerolineales bacterium]